MRALMTMMPAVRLPVRAKIALLGALPLVGLAAVAGAAWVGQQATSEAYEQQRTFTRASTAALELGARVYAMAGAGSEFLVKRSYNQETAFQKAAGEAKEKLAALKATPELEELSRRLDSAGRSLDQAASAFGDLVKAQDKLGRTGVEGFSGALADRSAKLDQLLKELTAAYDDTQDLPAAFLAMQRSDHAFTAGGEPKERQRFQEAAKELNRLAERIRLTPDRKAELARRLQAYVDAFQGWGAALEERDSGSHRVEEATRRLAGTAEAILKEIDDGKAAVDRRHAEAGEQARSLLLALTAAMGLVCGLLALLISGSISQPLRAMSGFMRRLAAGDTSLPPPVVPVRDELGQMADAVGVFRDALIQRQALEADQGAQVAARERRAAAVDALVRGFDASATRGLAEVRDAASRLNALSDDLTGLAARVAREAGAAGSSAESAAGEVSSVASAAEEMAASVREIAAQAGRSTEVAGRAVAQAGHTRERMEALASSAGRIGEVVSLIRAIADQTNLLALNATIEAARAGEAGRGFAVVASEVKNLASQTAKATEEIASQIQAIQAASVEAASSIGDVNAVITEMSGMAGAVAAAVEQQNATIGEIAQSVSRVSEQVRSGAGAMRGLEEAAAEARGGADGVGGLSTDLTGQAQALDAEVARFLSAVRAA